MSTMHTLLLLIALVHWVPFVLSLEAYYFVEQYTDASNVFGQVADPDKSSEYVKYLGKYNTLQECINTCVGNGTNSNKCETLTYMTATYSVNTYRKHCYGRYGKQYSSVWTAVPDQGAIAARIIYPCRSNSDCSLNGKCIAGNCTCNPGWNGYHCGILDLQPATKNAGYVYVNNISTWGGAVLVDTSDNNENTKYHMYLAQFDNHCGVNAWVPNSRVVHAQSTKGFNSQYVFRDSVHSAFSHEPVATYGPNGEFVVTYIAQNFSGPECECKDGSTPPGCHASSGNDFVQLMQWSDSSNGPWSEPAEVIEISGMDDPNLSGVILKNGTFIGLGRNWVSGYSSVYAVRGQDWKDGKQYKIISKSLFPQLVGGGTEDQFVYQDCDGNLHAIFNNQSPNYGIYVCGGHAYSADGGINWIYTGYAFGNNVDYTDGSSFIFTRRERPHFAFAKDGCTPIALTNGAQYGGSYGDATETLLQPLRQ